MKKLLAIGLIGFGLWIPSQLSGQNSNSAGLQNSNTGGEGNVSKHGPIFRATPDQIKQAQAILKARGFYQGEQTGKLDVDTRAGLKKYQTAESLRVTGTLNKATLEKMGIVLTDAQKEM
jgi:peptidoglycan hydrolase-like protein with peptidoglycan-binding domain